ncbi:MAG: MotA/TolQ/ExbB proton channel family protein [Bdellovibrionota bacterium]
MLSHIFVGASLLGAEWILYLLILLSVISVALILERVRFYRRASAGLIHFRQAVRSCASNGQAERVLETAAGRHKSSDNLIRDLETEMALAITSNRNLPPEALENLAHDSIARARLSWERNLAILATIGNNAPFIGLFGTVLGIIRAFHDLSQQAATGVQTVTAGISEALVATAIGLLVAIPAVIAFNLFQRKVKSALTEAEALKSFLIGKLAIKARE